jgi:hypothetical protein
VISNIHNQYRNHIIFFSIDRKERYQAQNNSFKGADRPVFDMEMILQATEKFSITNVVGEGGFGIVYKVLFFLHPAHGLLLYFILNIYCCIFRA